MFQFACRSKLLPILFTLTFMALIPGIAFGLWGARELLFEGDSAYAHISVVREDTQRCLLFGKYRRGRETCIDMSDPNRSIFEYTEMMFAGFMFVPQTKSIVLCGLGGGYIPTAIRNLFPDVTLTTVEIDPVVAELARKYFGYVSTDRSMLVVKDGRQFFKQNKSKHDQIWLDAFNADYIPAHMTTVEFLELVKSRLNSDGIVVANVHLGNLLFDSQVKTYRQVFKTVHVMVGEDSGNAIIVAGDRIAHDPESILMGNYPFKKQVGPIRIADQMIKIRPHYKVSADAKVLTDDYSPANILLHKGVQ